MPTLTRPSREIFDLLDTVLSDYHPELANAEVTVGLLAAWPKEDDDEDDACLKLHGYPCLAVARITPYRQRVMGIPDAVIDLDGPGWKKLTEAERVALLDHELTHFELALDADGHVKPDDAGRPKLKTRLHDYQLGGFAVVAARHGPAAIESQAFRATERAYRQQIFSWGEDQPIRADAERGKPEAPDLDAVIGATARGRSMAGVV